MQLSCNLDLLVIGAFTIGHAIAQVPAGLPPGSTCETQTGAGSKKPPTLYQTVDAGSKLITWLYNSGNGGVLRISAGDTQRMDMTSGFDGASHVTFRRKDESKTVAAENIDMTDVANAILKISASCARGTIPLGRGDWVIATDWEEKVSRVGKRGHPRDLIGSTSESGVALPLTTTQLSARQNDKDRNEKLITIAAFILYRLYLDTVASFFGQAVLPWADSEKSAVDELAKLAMNTMTSNKDNDNNLQVQGRTLEYGLYFNVSGKSPGIQESHDNLNANPVGRRWILRRGNGHDPSDPGGPRTGHQSDRGGNHEGCRKPKDSGRSIRVRPQGAKRGRSIWKIHHSSG